MPTKINSEPAANYNVPSQNKDDLIIQKALDILFARLAQSDQTFIHPETIKNYLILKHAEKKYEVFGIIHLDNQHRFLENEELFRGTVDGATVHVREIFRKAIPSGTVAMILYHNHPSQNVKPSPADQTITNLIKNAAELVNIRILDHIIIGGTDSYSFAENGLL